MINVSMEGVKDAVETTKELIIPWYKVNAVRKANLENAQRQAEIQRINAEVLASQAKTERERAAKELDHSQSELILAQAKKAEAEAKLLSAQAEKTLVEAEKERAILKQSQIELALKIISQYGTDGVSEVNKMEYLVKLIPLIEKITWSTIEPG